MTQVRSILTTSLLTLALVLTVAATALVLNDAQAVQADASSQIFNENQVVYLQLTDAPPVRDITLQRFAPLQ